MADTPLSIADVLDRAADLIEPEGAWTQGVLARDAQGKGVCGPPFSGACSYCASGAIIAAAGEFEMAYYDLVAHLIGDVVPVWNDAPGRTQSEVVSTLRLAASKAREQEWTGHD
jgi:hypothetical protein